MRTFCLSSIAIALLVANSQVPADENAHAGQAIQYSGQASANGSASAVHSIAASDQFTSAASAKVQKQGLVVNALESEINNCGFFAYPEKGYEKNYLIFATDMLGQDVARAWVNLGNGDIELKKISYQEDEKSIFFIFKEKGVQVSFKGTITSPSTESQEYNKLDGILSVSQGSNKKQLKVVAISGC